MTDGPTTPTTELEALSRKLQKVHALLLDTEREFHPALSPLTLLDRLVNDPAWAWLRPLSALIADIDHVLAEEQPPTEFDRAVVAAHVRGLLAGEGELKNQQFLDRYRAALQLNPELVALHGELKAMLKSAPAESENEAERLHARHRWAMRCKHRGVLH
jgi:hypothetical protein